MNQDLSKGKIYKITNDFNDEVYVGSTCNTLDKRFLGHKYDSKKKNLLNLPLYKLMNEIGFERFRIELICDFPCEERYQLREKEGEFIRQLGTLNNKVECRTQKEYYHENKAKYLEYHKEYVEKNKEKVKEYQKTIALITEKKI
jgi:hypothetical protein